MGQTQDTERRGEGQVGDTLSDRAVESNDGRDTVGERSGKSGADTTIEAGQREGRGLIPLSENALTDIVNYKATDSIALNVIEKSAQLYHEGEVEYQDMTLKADAVAVDFNGQTLKAYGSQDTNGRTIGRPVFKQKESEYLADTIRFNYHSKRGIISGVITQEGEGYLHGSKVKKMNDSVMYMNSGLYTTCNYEHPHFALNFTKSKLITGDKMLTGPAYITIADIPTPLAIPFAFVPLTHGRSSGILVPSYGWMNNRGYYLKDGGYYFALSDEWDLSLTGDIYTNLSWAINARTQYYKRYKYRGSMEARYGITKEGLEGDSNTYRKYSDFKFSWQHTQDSKANPYSRFSADVNLQSRNYNRNTTNRNDYFTSTTTSSIAYSTQIGSAVNLAATFRESFNAQTGVITIKLPSVTLNTVTLYPFRRKSPTGGYKWYENISLSYTLQADNNVTTQDTLLFTAATINKMQYGIQHSIPLSSTVKVFKYFNWTNSITYNERWHWSTIEKRYDSERDEVTIDTLRGFRANRDVSFSSTLSTRIYGMFTFKKGFLKAIRHVINPSISFNFRPDFGANYLGYWKQYTDNTGYVHRYSIFEQSLYGGPPDGRSGMIRMNIGNNLEIKVGSTNDTADEPKKITLLESFNIGMSYDLSKDSLNWSDLTISGRTTLFKCLILSYSGSFCPYDVDEAGRKHNVFLWEKERKLFRNDNSTYTLQFSYSMNNSTFKKGEKKKSQGTFIVPPIMQTPYNENPAMMMGNYADFSVPWNVSLNYTLSYVSNYVAKTYNYNHNLIQTLSVTASVNITDKWKIAVSTGYDFVNKGMSYTSIDIYRDLHCWEMRFNWVPFGYYKSWNFVINIKASALRDLKYEKRRSYQDNQGYYSY